MIVLRKHHSIRGFQKKTCLFLDFDRWWKRCLMKIEDRFIASWRTPRNQSLCLDVFRSSCSCGPRCLIAWMRRHRCFGWRDDGVLVRWFQQLSTIFCSISAPTSSWRNDPIWRIFFKYPPHIVDGRNPAPVDMVNIPLFIGFYTSQVVQDFFHQQLVFRRQKHKGEGIDITDDLDHFFKIPPASNVGIFGFPYRIAAWCSRRYPPAHCRHQMIQVGRILTLMLWRIWLEICCFFSCEMCGSGRDST